MTSYISRQHAVGACQRMQTFYKGLAAYYKTSGLDIESNRGRRNILMSEPMEIFLADELRKTNQTVVADGRTGKADIVIINGRLETELECKLTSPHLSSGCIAFQTDFETLERKVSLDYIYIIADPSFEKFCAIYFKGLTIEDFRALSPGARGKVQMYKHKGMKKATMLAGSFIDLNEISINKTVEKQRLYNIEANEKIEVLTSRLYALSETQVYDRNKIKNSIEIIKNDLSEKINKFNKDIKIKSSRTSRYTYKFESLEI